MIIPRAMMMMMMVIGVLVLLAPDLCHQSKPLISSDFLSIAAAHEI